MNRTKPNIWIYPCLFSAASVGAILFSPLLPSIQSQFDLSSDSVQLILSLYLLGFAASQILYTLPAKNFGKKKMIITALSLGLIGNLIVTFGAYTNLFSMILAGRVLCALGAGGTLGLGMGLILDFYTPKESVQIIALGVTSFGVFPSIGTFCAGFLVPFSWIWPLHLLSFYFIFLLIFVQSIPTIKESKEKISLSEFTSSVWQHISTTSFLAYACMWGTNTSTLYLYITYASLVAIKIWGVDIHLFSILISLAPLAMIAGMLLNRTFSERVGRVIMLRIGLLSEIGFITSIYYALQLEGTGRTVLFFSGITGVYFCTPIVTSNATSLGLEHSKDKSVGSALMGCLNLTMTTLFLFIVRTIPIDGELILDKIYVALGLLLALLFFLQKRMSNSLKF